MIILWWFKIFGGKVEVPVFGGQISWNARSKCANFPNCSRILTPRGLIGRICFFFFVAAAQNSITLHLAQWCWVPTWINDPAIPTKTPGAPAPGISTYFFLCIPWFSCRKWPKKFALSPTPRTMGELVPMPYAAQTYLRNQMDGFGQNAQLSFCGQDSNKPSWGW